MRQSRAKIQTLNSPAGSRAAKLEVRGDATSFEQADSLASRVWLCVGVLAAELRSVQTEQELYSLIYTSFLQLNLEIKTTGLTQIFQLFLNDVTETSRNR